MFNKKRHLKTKNVITFSMMVITSILLFIYLAFYSQPEVNGDMYAKETVMTISTDIVETSTFPDIETTTTTAEVTTTSTNTTMVTTTVSQTTTEHHEIQECFVEQTETTCIETESTYYYFYPDSYRVHTADCIYADSSCMERIEGDYIETARRCAVCNPDITIGTIYQPIEDEYDSGDSLTRNWSVSEMTYYSGPYGCYGAAGTTLINNYSVACNSIPLGTTVYIQSSDGSIDGYYRVDDTGGMGNSVIDIFYSDYSYVPEPFATDGRVTCQVWIVE